MRYAQAPGRARRRAAALGQRRGPADVVLDRKLGFGGRHPRRERDQQEADQPAEIGHPSGAEGAGEGRGDVVAVRDGQHQQAHGQRSPHAQPGPRQHHAADQHEGRDHDVGERVGEGVQPGQRLGGRVHDRAEHPQGAGQQQRSGHDGGVRYARRRDHRLPAERGNCAIPTATGTA